MVSVPEWDFVQGLQFKQQVPEDQDFVRLVYTIRLKKVLASNSNMLLPSFSLSDAYCSSAFRRRTCPRWLSRDNVLSKIMG